MRRTAIFVTATVTLAHVAGAQASRPDTADPYRWLEDVNGARSMSWVKAENTKTTNVLTMKLDGSNPTILSAYGGFEASSTPTYDGPMGKLWGVYVLANIRGGGEFGPASHEAGLKTKRQVIYDDFAAVAQDLITRKVTSLTEGVKYPTPLTWTTTKDDRVGPQHARKFAARMSEYGLPYYFYEVIEGGHGAGANAIQRHTPAHSFTPTSLGN